MSTTQENPVLLNSILCNFHPSITYLILGPFVFIINNFGFIALFVLSLIQLGQFFTKSLQSLVKESQKIFLAFIASYNL